MGLYKMVTMFVILEYRPIEETILHWKSLAHLGDVEQDEVGGRDWKNGSGVKNTTCSCRGLRSCSQHLHDAHSSATPILRGLTTLLWPLAPSMHAVKGGHESVASYP